MNAHPGPKEQLSALYDKVQNAYEEMNESKAEKLNAEAAYLEKFNYYFKLKQEWIKAANKHLAPGDIGDNT